MPTPVPVFDRRRPFTRAEALRHGITVAQLYGPEYQKVFRGLYVASDVPVDATLRAEAALHVAPAGSHVSHHTAAQIWRACPPADPDTHITVPKGTFRPRRQGVRAHEPDRLADVVRRCGVPLSSPVQTFLDLASMCSLVDLVVVGDSLVRERVTTPEALVLAAAACNGRGARLARRAARLVRREVDSPMETRVRLLIVLAGLPEPTVNAVLCGPDGSVRMRFDLCYPQLRLIIEYDGRQHAEDDAQWSRDIERREELDRLGWRIIVVRAKDVYVHPDRTLARIREAMRERGARDVPSRAPVDWRRHFPGRTAA